MKRLDPARIAISAVIIAGLFATGWKLAVGEPPQSSAKPTVQKQTDRKPKQDKPQLAKFMRAKLRSSSRVLEGLCTEDFALIEKGAKNLHTMSNEEKWRASNDAMYRQFSIEFRNGLKRLETAAKNKKLDAAALAWTKTTLNCIECHRWVKANLIAGK